VEETVVIPGSPPNQVFLLRILGYRQQTQRVTTKRAWNYLLAKIVKKITINFYRIQTNNFITISESFRYI
jgi:hypothetical protein